jgi:hypothetical protein
MPRAHKEDEFAALSSRAASPEARTLIDEVFDEVTTWELRRGERFNRRRCDARATPFRNTLERLVGDLLRARADPSSTGRIYRAMSPNNFTDDVVSYRNFNAAVHALSGLKLLEHTPGKPRYIAAFGGTVKLTGQVAKFRATRKLIQRATDAGVDLSKIDRHFGLEPPRHPLALRGAKVGSRSRKIAGVRRNPPDLARPNGWKTK